MNYGNTGGAEFNWNYSMGSNGGGGASPMYPQVSEQDWSTKQSINQSIKSQMGQMSNNADYGGGSQWLHSNQSHGGNPGSQSNYQMSHMGQGQSGSPFDDYNQSMMRYTNVSKADGKSDM